MEARNDGSVASYRTLDGSVIRELFNPSNSIVKGFSVAVADVDSETSLHRHGFGEVYYVLEGSGTMSVSGEKREVSGGDCVFIPEGSPHNIRPSGRLRILCFCVPAYSHEGTELL